MLGGELFRPLGVDVCSGHELSAVEAGDGARVMRADDTAAQYSESQSATPFGFRLSARFGHMAECSVVRCNKGCNGSGLNIAVLGSRVLVLPRGPIPPALLLGRERGRYYRRAMVHLFLDSDIGPPSLSNENAGTDRVALGMIGIQEAVRRCPVDHLGQLPSQVHRILHTGVEVLSTHRGMHVCGVAGQQDPSFAVGCGLVSHIGEAGDPGGAVDPVIGPVYGDERLTEIPQAAFGGGSWLPLGQHHPHPPLIL